MRKISYYSGEESKVTGPSTDLVDKESATEMGGRGLNLIEMTQDFDKTDPDSQEASDIIDALIELGDGLDNSGEETLANFADFLIKKFAEAENINYTVLFNSLILKINNADLVNTNDIIKKLTNIYSRTLSLEYLKVQDMEKAKESAYKKTLHRADQYLSEG